MEYLNTTLVLVGSIGYIYKSLDLMYLFQIKEYRFDRFISFVKEEGIARSFFLHPFKLPAKSFRNLVLFAFHLSVAAGLFFVLAKLSMITFSLFYIFVSFIFSIATTYIAIEITNIASHVLRSAIIYFAKRKIEKSKTVFIGITGSFGKTSVKEFLFHILSKKFIVAATEKNYNSDIGIALSVIRLLRNDTQFFIAEMGAYRIGEIAKCCKLTHPMYGILTGIGNQHLDLFGSHSNLVQAKFELIRSIPKKGRIYINRDVMPIQAIKIPVNASCCYYSTHKAANIVGSNITYLNHRLHASVMYKKTNFIIDTRLLGSHNIANLLPCIGLAYDLGMTKKDIEKAIQILNPVEHRLSISNGISGSTVLDDTYNSNVDGFIAAIHTADILPFKKKIIMTRGLIELGKEKNSSYIKIIKTIQASSSSITLYTTDPLFSKFGKNSSIKMFPVEDKLVKSLVEKVNKETLIVMEGRFSPNTISIVRSKI
ncbi:UDP-N-acetylmuramoyl-tripeptide--D-alanyl-D-alanine ligase [Candidatus Roizmanbacteria bacterium]|nr:UDP-N-acetylmuramoyl-tripeptide--D-alanyl-D-alanine ligase [Candidatus Roizmanbacteria bacterium]